MPVNFLNEDEIAKYGRFHGEPSREHLEGFFFLDDDDLDLLPLLVARAAAAPRAPRREKRFCGSGHGRATSGVE